MDKLNLLSFNCVSLNLIALTIVDLGIKIISKAHSFSLGEISGVDDFAREVFVTRKFLKDEFLLFVFGQNFFVLWQNCHTRAFFIDVFNLLPGFLAFIVNMIRDFIHINLYFS